MRTPGLPGEHRGSAGLDANCSLTQNIRAGILTFMKRLVVGVAVAVGVVALRGQLRPPDPQVIRLKPSPGLVETTAIARGRLLYERHGCVMCHGADGTGGRENLNAETQGKIPGVVKVAEGYTTSELARLVRTGTPRIGKADPSGPTPPYRMPGWGHQLSDTEIDELVRYLISLAPKTKGWR